MDKYVETLDALMKAKKEKKKKEIKKLFITCSRRVIRRKKYPRF